MSPAEVYQTAQIRELESSARERFGISGDVMMQRAGAAALQVFLKVWPQAKQVTVLTGPGNNGGDGYVFAQKAHERGLKVTLLHTSPIDKLKEEAARAYAACKSAGVLIHPFQHEEALPQSDVIVDAIYGIGLQTEVREEGRLILETVNRSGIPVLALDVPSGIDANTGNCLGVAIQATATVTFIGLKLGLLTGRGVAFSGKIFCDDLQLPAELFALTTSRIEILERAQFAKYLAPRRRDFYKGDAGHVLVVGGDVGFTGAPLMAAFAALRVGAGLVSIATHPKHAAFLNITHPEIMCHGVRTQHALQKLLQKATSVVVGPGLGQSFWSRRLLQSVLKTDLPLIVDADALNLLAQKPMQRSNWILTPHPGEAGRLLKKSTQAVQQDRLSALQAMQDIYGGVSVLKGAGTLIAASVEKIGLCHAGNPGMGTAGMGDVLSGVLGGLVAQGIPLAVSAKLGVLLHAKAGDLAAAEGGERGMIATDLMPFLRKLCN